METQLLTTAEAAAIGSIVGTISVFAIVFYVLLIIAGWKILSKAGESGWKILIPFYNFYMLYKIVGMKNWFWISLAVTIIASTIITTQTTPDNTLTGFGVFIAICESLFGIFISIMYAERTSRAFGHGLGYTIGLLFLPNIFQLIIGFGKSKYHKSAIKK